MLTTYLLLFFFLLIAAVIGMYFVQNYIFPKKIEEIAAMIESGQTRLAIKKLITFLEKDDRNAYAHYLLGEAYRKDQNTQYAIVEYRQVLKYGRFNDKMSEIGIRSKLATLYKKRNSMDDAKNEYLILTKIDSSNFINYYELGMLYFNMGVLEKAVGFLKKSVSVNAAHDMSFYYLGQIFFKTGLFADAKQMFINTIKLDTSNYKAHYYLGLVLQQQSDFEWAIKEFDVSKKSDEFKVQSLLAKGKCYMEKEQLPKAVTEFERGLKFVQKGSSFYLEFLYYLAECQEHIRDINSAIKNWEKIISIKPKYKDVQLKLNNYSEFREDDRIKDFLICGLAQFEHLSRKLVEDMGYNVIEIEIISDTEIEMVAIEMEGKWRNTRQSNRIIRIIRTTEVVPISLFRSISETMKAKNATRLMIITTGTFSQKAMEFANTRPIDAYDKTVLVDLLKKIG